MVFCVEKWPLSAVFWDGESDQVIGGVSVRISCIAFVLLLAPAALQATTIHVPADQPTIQAGIDASGPPHKNSVLVDRSQLSYSTYFGGPVVPPQPYSGDDAIHDIVVDSDGNIIIVGSTQSVAFPVVNAIQGSIAGSWDAFVAKLSPAGDSLIFSTYLGGDAEDHAFGVAVDQQGNIYVAGHAGYTFPLVNEFQSWFGGGGSAFVSKLSPDGSRLIYSTLIGGSNADEASDIQVDSLGCAYIVGSTRSPDFPTANPFQSHYAGGLTDVFVAKVQPSGGGLAFATFLGGDSTEYGSAIVLAGPDRVVVAGGTESADFPLVNPFQGELGSYSRDAFVSVLSSTGESLQYSTFLGGNDGDEATGLGVDADGDIYVAGGTSSYDFPVLNALQPTKAGYGDCFISKLNSNGSSLLFSTFLGGSGNDAAGAVATDDYGFLHVVGYTESADFPTVSPIQSAIAGARDAFTARLALNGDSLSFSTFLGGSMLEMWGAIGCVFVAGTVTYVGGSTDSPDFPVVDGYQSAYAGGQDGFLTVITQQCADADADGYGDPGHPENECPDDNCPETSNPDQVDSDDDGVGNVCDNCPAAYNPTQSDADADGVGDACDRCPGSDDHADIDGDSVPDDCDNCMVVHNPTQTDTDGDGWGDVCDNCPLDYNLGQQDTDGDGVGDFCDLCPGFNDHADADADGVPDSCDNCPTLYNYTQHDIDGDGIGDACDMCPWDSLNDVDGDGICGNVDNCPFVYNPDQADSDGDGVGDACESCCRIVGDIDHNGTGPDISDLVYLVSYMFSAGPEPPCSDNGFYPESDIDGNQAGPDISDLVFLVTYMFASGPAPVECA